MGHTAIILISEILYILSSSSSLSLEFHYIKEGRNWTVAQKYCKTRFENLVTLTSLADVNTVITNVTTADPGYTGAVWIGLRRTWTWSTGDLLSGYSGWSSVEPNAGNTEAVCGLITASAWADVGCTASFYFFCMNASRTDSSRFIFITFATNWMAARDYCRRYYTDLAVITSLQEQQILTAHYGTYCIGLSASQWSDFQTSTFRYWKSGQNFESSLINKCTAMDMADSGKWDALECSLQKPFVCYGSVDKVKIRQLLKVVLTSSGVTNLNDPSVRAAILNEIEKKVKERVIDKNASIRWKVKNDGSVFEKVHKT